MIDSETGEIVDYKQNTPQFRTMYNYDRDVVSNETALTCPEETLTQQHFKEECDINNLMEKFGVTGLIEQNIRPVLPDEYTEIFDFHSAMNTLTRANEEFMKMNAGTRARFQNNPQVFTEWFSQAENHEEATKLGLMIKRPPETKPEPIEVIVKEPIAPKKD